jgi:hypothetical protein
MVLSVATRRGCRRARSSGSPLQITVMSDLEITRYIRFPICSISFNSICMNEAFCTQRV